MAGFGMDVNVTDNASSGLLRLVLAGQDPKPAFVAMVDHMELVTRKRFDTETSPDGKRWTANQPSTRKFSIKKVLHGETLHLRDLFEHSIDNSGFIFGSNRIYARIHQLGGEAGPKARRIKLPARPYLGVNADDGKVFEEEIVSFMRRTLG